MQVKICKKKGIILQFQLLNSLGHERVNSRTCKVMRKMELGVPLYKPSENMHKSVAPDLLGGSNFFGQRRDQCMSS